MPSESNSSFDDSELRDLEDSNAEIQTGPRTQSPKRDETSTRRGGKPEKSRSERFRRTSVTAKGSATKIWKPRGSDKVDQSVNLMDRNSYEMKDSTRSTSKRSRSTAADLFWESQSLDETSSSGDHSFRMSELSDVYNRKKSAQDRKRKLFFALFVTAVVLTILLFTVPKFGLIKPHKKADKSGSNEEAAPNPPPTEEKKEEETQVEEPEREQGIADEIQTILTEGELTAEEEEVLDLSQVPKTTRLEAFQFFVVEQDISDETELEAEGSPANKALRWITEQDPAEMEIPGLEDVFTNNVEAERALLQRYALAVLYFAQVTDAPSSASAVSRTRNAGRQLQSKMGKEQMMNREAFENSWLSVKHICEWHGIVCAEDYESVVEVRLPKHMFHGTIPRELLDGAAMPHLELLDLSSNQLQGSIPDVTQHREDAGTKLGVTPPSSSLKILQLGSNRLSGDLDVILGFPGLKILDLSANSFGGKLSTAIAKLPHISTLDLSENNFEGSIPTNYGDMSGLTKLYLDGNKNIDGNVPSHLGKLDQLSVLHLEGTSVSGEMPPEVCALREPSSSLGFLVVPCEGVTCDCCTDCV